MARRSFLSAAAGAIAGFLGAGVSGWRADATAAPERLSETGLTSSDPAVGSGWRENTLLQSFTADSFRPHVKDLFSVAIGSGEELELRLARVDERSPGPGSAVHSFSLEFTGPVDKPLGQGSYAFRHDSMGEFTLFIVPVAQEADLRWYQAVFSRLTEQPGRDSVP